MVERRSGHSPLAVDPVPDVSAGGAVHAVLEGGPCDLPENERRRGVAPIDRRIKVEYCGGYEHFERVDGTGWDAPHVFQFTVVLTAGGLQLTFYNDESPAPDLDKVVIT